MLADFGDSDLLCYRAAGPDALIEKQAAAWNPLLDWAASALGARLSVGQGVMHVAQSPEALDRMRARVAAFDEFALAGAHDLISISGSLVLALAVIDGRLTAKQAWDLSRVDEDWQISQWGADEEAAAVAATKLTAFKDAHRFYELSQA